MIRHIYRSALPVRPGGWAWRALTGLGAGRMRTRAPYDGRATKRRRRGTAVRADVARGGFRAVGGAAARRLHARCSAAKVRSTGYVRSAPMIHRPRRLRAVRALPSARPRRTGMVEALAWLEARVSA